MNAKIFLILILTATASCESAKNLPEESKVQRVKDDSVQENVLAGACRGFNARFVDNRCEQNDSNAETRKKQTENKDRSRTAESRPSLVEPLLPNLNLLRKHFNPRSRIPSELQPLQAIIPQEPNVSNSFSNEAPHNFPVPPAHFPPPQKEKELYYFGERNDDGSRHGLGKYTWENGDVYEGNWANGNMEGKGRFESANGDIYDGDWLDGRFHGNGKRIYKSGSIYEGSFSEGTRSGTGRLLWHDGSSFYGSWVKDKRQGKGLFTWPNSDWYEGDFYDNKMHGKGKHHWVSQGGAFYEGEWENGVRHGYGTHTLADGSFQRGNFF